MRLSLEEHRSNVVILFKKYEQLLKCKRLVLQSDKTIIF